MWPSSMRPILVSGRLRLPDCVGRFVCLCVLCAWDALRLLLVLIPAFEIKLITPLLSCSYARHGWRVGRPQLQEVCAVCAILPWYMVCMPVCGTRLPARGS